jgi:hypothetical protein
MMSASSRSDRGRLMGRKSAPRTALLQSVTGGISAVSISLSGIDSRASSSALSFAVNGSGLPLFIVSPLVAGSSSRADDSAGVFIVRPGVDYVKHDCSIHTRRPQSRPSIFIGIGIRDRDREGIAECAFSQLKAHLMLLKIPLCLLDVPGPMQAGSPYLHYCIYNGASQLAVS